MDQFTKDLGNILFSNGNIKEYFRQRLETAINQLLRAELTTLLGYDLYDRSGFNSGDSRNGQYYRTIKSEFGQLHITVPRDRLGKFHNQLIPNYEAHQDSLETTIIQLYSKGVSTRQISNLIWQMYGSHYSAGTVSNITAQMTKQIQAFHQRKIQDNFVCLFLDATYLPLRRDSVQREAVYVALGINACGVKEVLDYRIAPTENKVVWGDLLKNLKQRGLGQALLVIADGMVGLQDTVKSLLPRSKFQRCHVHVMRNLASQVRVNDRAAILHDFKQLHHAKNAAEAHQELDHFYQTWQKAYPRIVQHIKSIEPELLPFLDFPPAIRSSIYSTNLLESFNKIIKRRTKAKEQFPNEQSLDRFIGTLAINYNEKNKSQTHRGFGQVRDTLESMF